MKKSYFIRFAVFTLLLCCLQGYAGHPAMGAQKLQPKNLLSADNCLQEALKLFRQKEFSQTSGLLDNCYRGEEPILAKPLAAFVMGYSLFAQHEYFRAEPFLRAAGRNKSSVQPYARYVLAENLFYIWKRREATAILLELFGATPRFWGGRLPARLGDFYYARGMHKKAEKYYSLALKKNYRQRTNKLLLLFIRAEIKWRLGKKTEAIKNLKKIVIKYPYHADSVLATNRLTLLKTNGFPVKEPSLDEKLEWIHQLIRGGKAERALKELKLLPKHLTTRKVKDKSKERSDKILYLFARAYTRQRNYAQAISQYKKLLAQSPGPRIDYQVLRKLAYLNNKLENFQQAHHYYIKHYNRYYRLSRARNSLFYAGLNLMYAGQYKSAIEIFKRYLRKYPRSYYRGSANWYIGWSYYLQSEYFNSRIFFEKLFRLYPQSTMGRRGRYWTAISFKNAKQKGEACQRFQQIVNDSPPDKYYHLLALDKLVYYCQKLIPSMKAQTSPQENREEAENQKASALVRGPQMSLARDLTKLGFYREVRHYLQKMYRKSGYKNGRRLKLAQMADYLGIYKLSMDIVANHLTCHLTLPQGKYNKIVGDNRKVWHLGYPRGFLELVEKEAEKYAISPYLLLAVIRQESRFDKRAVSPADARGLMQIIPPTANRLSHLKGIRNFNLKQLFEPQVSIAMGAKYFSELLKKYYGQLPMAVGAYNAGPLAMTRWLDLWSALNVEEFIEQVPYRETRKYMRRVLSGYVIYRWLYGGRKRVMSLPEEVYLNYRDNINF